MSLAINLTIIFMFLIILFRYKYIKKHYLKYFTIVIFAVLFDILTTYNLINKYGIWREGNELIKTLYGYVGIYSLFLFMLFVLSFYMLIYLVIISSNLRKNSSILYSFLLSIPNFSAGLYNLRVI